MQRCPSLVLFVVSSLCFTLSKAQKMNGSDLSCLRLSPADDGLTRITFLVDVAGVRSLYVSRWSEYQRLERCERITDPVLTERYVSSCNRSDTQEQEIIQRFNISLLLAPDAPCVSSSAPKSGSAAGKIRRKRTWTFPGTLWCGTGSRAVRYDQLGMFESADRCCRDHDHCLHIIPAHTRNYGVFNFKFYTISHCDCDLRFRQCLHDVNDSISNMVGYTFFSLVQVPCFQFKQQQRCTEKHWLGRCKVPKDAPHVVFKSPLPYTKIKSRSEDGNRSTSGEKQPVTKGAVITPHTTSPKHEHACTSKDPPTGDSSVHRRNYTKEYEIHRNVTGVTEIPSISRLHNTSTSLEKHLLNASKTLSNEKRAGKKKSTRKSLSADQRIHIQPQGTREYYPPMSTTQRTPHEQNSSMPITVATKTTKSHKTGTTQSHCCGVLKQPERGDTFQSHCKGCLKKNMTYHMTTFKPAWKALEIYKKTTEPPKRHTMGTATSATPSTTEPTTVTSMNKQTDSHLLWTYTSPEPTTKASSTHAPKGLKLHIALRNLTDYQLRCNSLKHLDECRYKILPLEKKYGLQNNETKTAYHCDCMSWTAVQIESLKQPSSVPSLLMDFVSQYCFKLPKEEKCNNRKSCSRGFTKASDLLEALKKIEEKDTAGVRKSGYGRKRGIPVRLYKRCLRLEREADVIAQLT